jgi:hypothetical protein
MIIKLSPLSSAFYSHPVFSPLRGEDTGENTHAAGDWLRKVPVPGGLPAVILRFNRGIQDLERDPVLPLSITVPVSS